MNLLYIFLFGYHFIFYISNPNYIFKNTLIKLEINQNLDIIIIIIIIKIIIIIDTFKKILII